MQSLNWITNSKSLHFVSFQFPFHFSNLCIQTTTTQRTMPTIAAVPAQRTTQRAATPSPTKKSKRPNSANEIPATVSVQEHPDHIWRINDQPSDVEYTFYTFHVNIWINWPKIGRTFRMPIKSTLRLSSMHSTLTICFFFFFFVVSNLRNLNGHLFKYSMFVSVLWVN